MRGKGFIYWIEELCQEDNELVGKKCANLGELARIGVRVPPGFAISIGAWERFVELTGMAEAMKRLFEEEGTDLRTPAKGEKISRAVRALIESQEMPGELGEGLRATYGQLCQKAGMHDVPVAVRSAGAVSMPGAMETYLNVRGEEDVLKKVLRVWSSAYTYRAILYRHTQHMSVDYAPIGVAVLQLVDAKSAGVLMTANPTSGNTGEMVIESNWGLGESVVSGIMNPDRFNVAKGGLVTTSRAVNRKLKMVVPRGDGTETIDIPAELQEASSLADDEVRELARVGLEIERHFGVPTDIEWAYAAQKPFPEGLYFLQARPMKPLPVYKDAIDKILDMIMKP
jgi:pyruvate, water dikinase